MKKILVIEDEAQTRDIFLECLKAEGFDPIGAENGRVGLHRVQEQLPDLVICETEMPELDGYGVLTALRQNPITATIPFIFLTGRVTKAEYRQCMDLGADDYITKPSTVEELLRAINARLQRQDTLRHGYAAQFQQVPESPSADTGTFSATPKSIFPSVPQLGKVFDFIEANYHQPITLSDVAQAVGYSPAYLTNLVGQQTGKTLYCWIVERRMAEARSLILENEQTVNQIAVSLGYKNASSFSRKFCQFHGASPKAWRHARLR